MPERRIIFKEDNFPSKRIYAWKKEGNKLVFTNGCFDILHRGHIHYLRQAAKLGDKLIVGLNSDNSVKRIKGENRPIKNQENRWEILSALEMVDLVIVFEEDTPLELIKQILPDILVKGGDWKIEEIVGYDLVKEHGGQVYSLDWVEGESSSKFIQKLRS